MKTVNSTEIKNRMGQYFQQAMAEPIYIERNGRPFAVLMSVEEYERLTRIVDAYWGEKAKAAEAEGFLSEQETKEFLKTSLNVKA
jgi:prevent-host-death family protein